MPRDTTEYARDYRTAGTRQTRPRKISRAPTLPGHSQTAVNFNVRTLRFSQILEANLPFIFYLIKKIRDYMYEIYKFFNSRREKYLKEYKFTK